MDSGELVLMDVGAECSDYATDVTRTVPANGKFTPRQREIYEVVLGAQKAAIAAVKPGAVMRGGKGSLQQIARDYIDSHGKDLHGESLGKYFTHGLGHYVGLDVHDPGDLSWPLEARHDHHHRAGRLHSRRKHRRPDRGHRSGDRQRREAPERRSAARARRNREADREVRRAK